MGIRQYLALVRRQRWVVVMAVVLVMASTAAFYQVRTPVYRATATVVLQPGDPSERFFVPPNQVEAPPNVETEAIFAASFPVAAEAATGFPGVGPEELLEDISVTADAESRIVRVAVTRPDPVQARDMANAVARAFVDSRRQAETADLQRVSNELGVALERLQREIANLDAQIGDGGIATGAQALNPAGVGPPGSLTFARYAATIRYQEIFERQQLLLIEQSVRTGGVELAAPAPLPLRPVGPNLLYSGLVAGFVGLLVGLGLGLLRDHLDERVRTRDEAESETGLAILAELPRRRQRRRAAPEVASAIRPHGALAEAARGLRTRLQRLDPQAPVRRMVITSPSRREGKSFVATHLAMAYAQAGYQTILVSADLRRPTLEGIFEIPQDMVGLSTVVGVSGLQPAPLASDEGRRSQGEWSQDLHRLPVEEALIVTFTPNLFFLPCGPLPPNPAELLSSAGMTETLDHLSRLADVVLIDSPPVLAVTDASVLAAQADGVVLVAASGQTTRRALRQAHATLAAANTRVLGVVLNKVLRRPSENDDYYDEAHRAAGVDATPERSDGNTTGSSPHGVPTRR